jgi:hypothetical protein
MPDLTPDEILNILCALNQKIDTVRDSLLLVIDKIGNQLDFQDMEILKARMDSMAYSIKTPRERIDSLEKSFKGLIQFVTSKETPISMPYTNKRNYKYK